MHESSGAHEGQKRRLDHLELELKWVVGSVQVLGTELGSSGRTTGPSPQIPKHIY